MADQTFIVPVSSGILEHRARIGASIWVFIWMIDRTTKETPIADGCLEGLVYGGRPIRAQEIAESLQTSRRTVQEHLDHLVAGGYLRRISCGFGVASGYAVQRSKKWKSKLTVVGAEETLEAALIPAQVREKTAGGARISAALYRNNTQTK